VRELRCKSNEGVVQVLLLSRKRKVEWVSKNNGRFEKEVQRIAQPVENPPQESGQLRCMHIEETR
jgi:hypothetical protein